MRIPSQLYLHYMALVSVKVACLASHTKAMHLSKARAKSNIGATKSASESRELYEPPRHPSRAQKSPVTSKLNLLARLE